MSVREYTAAEKTILDQVTEMLKKNGLSPFDTVNGLYLLTLKDALDKGICGGIMIYTETQKLLNEALSRKAGTVHKETLERILN